MMTDNSIQHLGMDLGISSWMGLFTLHSRSNDAFTAFVQVCAPAYDPDGGRAIRYLMLLID